MEHQDNRAQRGIQTIVVQFAITLVKSKPRIVCRVVFPDASELDMDGDMGIVRGLFRELLGMNAEELQGAVEAAGGQLTQTFTVLQAPAECAFVVKKWKAALVMRQKYIRTGIGNERDRGQFFALTPEKTMAEHELTHHGETPHTLRHWLRGGNVLFESRVSKNHRWKQDMIAQWGNVLVALKGAMERDFPDTPLCLMAEEDQARLTKINHTDLQYMQVPALPARFFAQLRCELNFPRTIRHTDGYQDIKNEVKRLWERAYGNAKVGVIMWVRFVPAGTVEEGNANRVIHGYELKGCLQAAQELSERSEKVLVLGDENSLSRFGDNYRLPKDVLCMLGMHMKLGDNRRSQLQQLQFLTALVRVCGARLVLGERSGSVDKVSLCGGIPCCQFVGKDVRQGNDRLDEVYLVGCGMGFNVSLSGAAAEPAVKREIVTGGRVALEEHAQLKASLEAWNSRPQDEPPNPDEAD